MNEFSSLFHSPPVISITFSLTTGDFHHFSLTTGYFHHFFPHCRLFQYHFSLVRFRLFTSGEHTMHMGRQLYVCVPDFRRSSNFVDGHVSRDVIGSAVWHARFDMFSYGSPSFSVHRMVAFVAAFISAVLLSISVFVQVVFSALRADTASRSVTVQTVSH